jgi:hypothetical protein
MCPRDYRYAPSVFARTPEVETDVLYVVGGLYGNFAALDAVEQLAASEDVPVTIVFNGDFHWFDAEAGWFAEIERRVARHRAIRGNVETEIARVEDVGAGCGCFYPASVSDDVVRRSNAIQGELMRVASREAMARLALLPMHLVAQVGELRIGIVHGDAASLSGWGFSHDTLDDGRDWLTDVRRASRIDVFASTHTCLAALRDFALPADRLTIINNGAAGMPNFAGSRSGVVSRIATRPSPHRRLYGLVRDRVYIDAVALDEDHAAFLARFLARWPHGSPAHASYYRRILAGPDYTLSAAYPSRQAA